MGLKTFRNGTDKKPKHNCSNCKCKRYTTCRCIKSNKN